jgi:hypothetical protein
VKIAIQVIDGDGNPVSGATVDIFDGATEVAGNQRSNADGRITISNQATAAGHAIKFIVTKPEFKKLEQVEHPTDDSLNVTLRLQGIGPIPPPPDGRWIKKAVVIGAALVAIIVIVWIKFNPGSSTLPVPEIIGVASNKVSTVFKDSGFKLEYAGTVTTGDQPPGNVAQQDPVHDTPKPRDSIVKYWVEAKKPGPNFAGTWINERRAASTTTLRIRGQNGGYQILMYRGTNLFTDRIVQGDNDRLKFRLTPTLEDTIELMNEQRLQLTETIILPGVPPHSSAEFFNRQRIRVPMRPEVLRALTNR